MSRNDDDNEGTSEEFKCSQCWEPLEANQRHDTWIQCQACTVCVCFECLGKETLRSSVSKSALSSSHVERLAPLCLTKLHPLFDPTKDALLLYYHARQWQKNPERNVDMMHLSTQFVHDFVTRFLVACFVFYLSYHHHRMTIPPVFVMLIFIHVWSSYQAFEMALAEYSLWTKIRHGTFRYPHRRATHNGLDMSRRAFIKWVIGAIFEASCAVTYLNSRYVDKTIWVIVFWCLPMVLMYALVCYFDIGNDERRSISGGVTIHIAFFLGYQWFIYDVYYYAFMYGFMNILHIVIHRRLFVDVFYRISHTPVDSVSLFYCHKDDVVVNEREIKL